MNAPQHHQSVMSVVFRPIAHSARILRFVLTSLALVLTFRPGTAYSQACYLQQDCGPGMLCSESGTCTPIRNLLNTGSNSVYWVDQALGNDSNSGSESQPFKSISRAMRSGTLKAGDAVIIREGTYYEEVRPQTGGSPGNRITITGFPGEEVVVSGAQKIDGNWQADGDAWKLPWPYAPLWNRVVANDPFGPARRRDVIIANGKMLQAVYTRNDVREGTFFMEGSPSNPTTVYVKLSGNANPNNASMLTSLKNHLFNPSNNEPDCRHGMTYGYFHLIGITFRHAANDGQAGAVCSGAEGSILENITVEWTNGSGFLVYGKNNVLRGVRAFNNGMSGIRGYECDGCLVEHSASKYNNWKGYEVLWESGGGKWGRSTNSTIRKVDFSDNNGPGLWLDTDNFDNVIEQSRFDNNLAVNLFLEFDSNRNTVRNNVFTRARNFRPNFYGHGVLIHSSENNLILYNTFQGNEGGGIRILTDSRGPASGNRYYNNLFVANTKLTRGTNHRGSEISFEQHTSLAEARSNKGDGNVFWYRNYAEQEYHTFQFRPDNPSTNGVLKSSTLSQWQQIAQTDWQSGITDLSNPHVRDTTDHVAGWRLAENSQYLGRAVALPGDMPAVLYDFDGDPRPTSGGAVGADHFGPGGTNGDTGGSTDTSNGADDNSGNTGDGAAGNDNTNNTDGGTSLTQVQFVSVDVAATANRVDINWEATNEHDLDSYVLQRSTDGENFERIGSIERVPDPSAPNQYSYSDQDLPSRSRTLYYRIQNVYNDRSVTYSAITEIQLALPDGLQLDQNYPNPAKGLTRISYQLPKSMGVNIKLYDALGREVRTLVDIGKPAGAHTIYLDAGDLPSGIYFYRFEADGVIQTRSMSVVR